MLYFDFDELKKVTGIQKRQKKDRNSNYLTIENLPLNESIYLID